MSKLTHLDAAGRARMVDVSDKPSTAREAVAEGFIRRRAETLALALSGDGKKGAVGPVAELAGVMGAKQTSTLIPLAGASPWRMNLGGLSCAAVLSSCACAVETSSGRQKNAERRMCMVLNRMCRNREYSAPFPPVAVA